MALHVKKSGCGDNRHNRIAVVQQFMLDLGQTGRRFPMFGIRQHALHGLGFKQVVFQLPAQQDMYLRP